MPSLALFHGEEREQKNKCAIDRNQLVVGDYDCIVFNTIRLRLYNIVI